MKSNKIPLALLLLACYTGASLFAGKTFAQVKTQPNEVKAQPDAQKNASTCVGINDHIIWRTNAEQDVAFTKYADSNTKFLRVGADWNVLQPGEPTAAVPFTSAEAYNARYLDRLDYFFQKATAAKIRVLLCPSYAPDWAVAGDTKNQGGWAPDADKASAFADFCEFLLRRYTTLAYTNSEHQHTLEAMEIWNEPDLGDIFFKPYKRYSAAGATTYANMVVAAGGRIQSVRATIGADDVRVLAPVVSNVHNVCWAPKGQVTWMDAFYDVAGITSKYDVFDWHTYWQSSKGWLPVDLPPAFDPVHPRYSVLGQLTAPDASEIWKKMVAHGDDLKPNWCTETGGAARLDTPNHNPGAMLSLVEQQTLVADGIATLRAGKVTNLDRIYFYELFDEPHLFKSSEAYYGLMALSDIKPLAYTTGQSLTSATFSPKPAYVTYKEADKGSASLLAQAKPLKTGKK